MAEFSRSAPSFLSLEKQRDVEIFGQKEYEEWESFHHLFNDAANLSEYITPKRLKLENINVKKCRSKPRKSCPDVRS
jgi:hypothetical protein